MMDREQKRIVAYVRVSTQGNNEQKTAFEIQVEQYKRANGNGTQYPDENQAILETLQSDDGFV